MGRITDGTLYSNSRRPSCGSQSQDQSSMKNAIQTKFSARHDLSGMLFMEYEAEDDVSNRALGQNDLVKQYTLAVASQVYAGRFKPHCTSEKTSRPF